MKKLLLILLCLPLISISQDSILISGNQVSIFQVGKKVPNIGLINEFIISKQEEMFSQEGEDYYLDVYYVQLDSDTIISIQSDYESKDIIGQIFILSGKIRTKEGIGIGSTIEDFTLKYNDYSIWWTYISDMCVIDTRKYDKVQFILDVSDLQMKQGMRLSAIALPEGIRPLADLNEVAVIVAKR